MALLAARRPGLAGPECLMHAQEQHLTRLPHFIAHCSKTHVSFGATLCAGIHKGA